MPKLLRDNKKLRAEKAITVITPRQILEARKAKTLPTAMGKLGIPRGQRANVVLKEKIIKKLWQGEHKVSPLAKFSKQRRFIEAMADNLAGEALKDSALKYGVTPDALMQFKSRFFKADSSLPQFLEELFFQAAARSVSIFHDKAESMSAPQAAVTAGIFSERGVAMRKARTANYQDVEVPLATLQKMAVVMEKIKEMKKGKIIDVEVETKALPERSES